MDLKNSTNQVNKKIKLQTQFTVPNKEFKDLDYVKKVEFLEETLNKE